MEGLMNRSVPHGIFESRERCIHNMRFQIFGKPKICLICQCNKIDDLLVMECSGNRKLSSGSISEIIHHFKIMNSVLDVPIDENLVEILLSPVLRTSIGLLKIHNDEVGIVVAKALDKICLKVPKTMLESFLEKLSAQILERASFGNLECLSVLLQRNKECLSSFLKNYGAVVLPNLFRVLEFHVSNIIKCPLHGANAAMLAVRLPSTSLVEINKVISESQGQTQSQNSSYSSTPASLKTFAAGTESLRIVEKLLDVLKASCPSDAFVVVTNNELKGSQLFSSTCSEDVFSIFSPFLTENITSCMKLLNSNETLRMPLLPTKILSFLDRLFLHAETLGSLFSGSGDISAASFCSLIKKLFYSHSVEIKIAALGLVRRMVTTYKNVMEDSCSDKGSVAYFPNVISQVELIHVITEAMNTSCENLFRAVVETLDLINQIPLFRNGRMIPVLEATLRVSKMHIPDHFLSMSTYIALNQLLLNILTSIKDVSISPGIQRQLIYLFESLPSEWTAVQFLSWIKLLLFCHEAEHQEKLWSIFVTFVERSKNVGYYCVIPLKCVLLIAYALMKCSRNFRETQTTNSQMYTQSLLSQPFPSQNFKQSEELARELMHCLMQPSFSPSILTLVRHGTSDDGLYITSLLELLKNYPTECLSVSSTSSFGSQSFENVQVTYDSENGGGQVTENRQDPVYEIEIEQNSGIKLNEVWCWTPKLYMQVLGATRLNLEFIASQQLFDLWNENVARILSVCYSKYLPQLQDSLKYSNDHTSSNSQLGYVENFDGIESSSDYFIIRRILDKLDIDASNWAQNIGKGIFSSDSDRVNLVEKAKHDVVLAFYFFYALFAGKDIAKFLDADYSQRLSSFLYECLNQYDMTQDIGGETRDELDWTKLSFYFRTALVIVSFFPLESASTFPDVFEKFLCDLPEAQSLFKDDVMVYHSSVFITLIQWQTYVSLVSLVEMWLLHDKSSCIAFFTDGSFDDQLKAEINNSLISLASKGNEETSAFAVEVASKRLKKFKLSFDFNVVKTNIHELMREACFDDVDEETVPLKDTLTLHRLSNVMQLAIEDDFLFTSEEQFPTNFLYVVVQTLLKFHAKKFLISSPTLKLLLKILLNEETFKNVNAYLITHRDFIKFLGSCLPVNDKNDVEVSIHAHKLLALLIVQNVDKFSLLNFQETPWITWKLSTFLSYIYDIPRIEILELLLALFKINFKCPLLQVEELNDSDKFVKVLLNLLFHLQGLSQKGIFVEFKETVWEILFEYLRLASVDVIKDKPSFLSNILFQPWTKVAIAHLFTQCKNIPSKAPMMSLEFINKWTRMMLLNKLENPSKRTPLQERFVFQAYVTLFQKIKECMIKDPTQQTPRNEQQPQHQASLQEGHQKTLLESRVDCFAIQRKTELISQIVKNCDIFLSSLS